MGKELVNFITFGCLVAMLGLTALTCVLVAMLGLTASTFVLVAMLGLTASGFVLVDYTFSIFKLCMQRSKL
jgi:hypothetical protein